MQDSKYKYLTLQYILLNVANMFMSAAMIGYVLNYLSSLSVLTDASGNPKLALIGLIIGIGSVLSIVAQTFFSSWLDRTDVMDELSFLRVISIASLITGIGMTVIPDSSYIVVILTVLAIIVVNISMPIINTIAFLYEKEGKTINYGVCRGIGSGAYACGAYLLGALWKTLGKNIITIYVIVFSIVLIATITMMPKPKRNDEVKEKGTSFIEFFKKYKAAFYLTLGMVFIYFTHMMLNVYLKIIVEGILGEAGILARIEASANYSSDALIVGSEAYITAKDAIAANIQGIAVAIAAMLELPAMSSFTRIAKKFDINKIMIFAGMMYLLKHALMLVCTNEYMLYGIEVLQMFGYGVMTPALVYWCYENIPASDSNKGQSAFIMSLTIASLFTTIICGYLFEHLSVRMVLLIGLIVTVIGVFFIYVGVNTKQNNQLNN